MSALPEWSGLFVTCAGVIITMSSFQAGSLRDRLRNRLGAVIFTFGFLLGAWLDQQEARQDLFRTLALFERASGPMPGLLQEEIADEVRELASPWLALSGAMFGLAVGLFAVELARVTPWRTSGKAVAA